MALSSQSCELPNILWFYEVHYQEELTSAIINGSHTYLNEVSEDCTHIPKTFIGRKYA